MTDTPKVPPYTPAPFLISSCLLTSSQLATLYDDFRKSIQYVSAAPELVFERLVANLNGAFNAAFEIERQQHASDLKMSQDSNDGLREELAELKSTNQELVKTLEACTCSRTSTPDPLTGERPTPIPTPAVTAARTRPNPHIGTSRIFGLNTSLRKSDSTSFDCPYSVVPGIPIGLTEVYLGQNENLCIKSYTSNINTDGFSVHIDSWKNTALNGGSCSWLEIESDDPDFQFGSYNTLDDHPPNTCRAHYTREIMFKRAYDAPPVVVVWLAGFDMDKEQNFRIKTYAKGVTATGFTINIKTWGGLVLYSAVSSWVAYTAGIPKVCSGHFSTLDLRPSHFSQSETSGYERFGENVFSGTPRTMLVINSLDVGRGEGLNFGIRASSADEKGMKWHLDGWSTKVYSAGASYIAMS